MARIGRPDRADLSAAAQQVWDRIAGKRGDVRGPYAVLIHTPDLAGKVADLGALLRFDGHLPGNERELAILATARTLGAAFEWVMHEPIARKEGTSPETIELVRALGPMDLFNQRERLIVELVRSLCVSHGVPDNMYEQANKELGTAYVVELVTLVGFYVMIALVLAAFEVDLPEGASRPF